MQQTRLILLIVGELGGFELVVQVAQVAQAVQVDQVEEGFQGLFFRLRFVI